MVEAIRRGDIPGVQLRYRHRVGLEQPEVWWWLTRSDLLGHWLADRVTEEATVERAITLSSSVPRGEELRERLTVVAAKPPRSISYDLQQLDAGWPVPTRVTLDLTPLDEGTQISVLQEGFAHLPLSDCLTIWEAYRRRWRAALRRLEAALSSGH